METSRVFFHFKHHMDSDHLLDDRLFVFLKSGSCSTSGDGVSRTGSPVGSCFLRQWPAWPGWPPGFRPVFSPAFYKLLPACQKPQTRCFVHGLSSRGLHPVRALLFQHTSQFVYIFIVPVLDYAVTLSGLKTFNNLFLCFRMFLFRSKHLTQGMDLHILIFQ